MWEKKGFVLAHRGNTQSQPENSIASIQSAMKYHADGVEFDVHLSKDGVPVVIHDDTVDRTTQSSGQVSSFTAAELGAMEISIPTLAALLAVLPNRAIANVELKEYAPYTSDDFLKFVLKDLEPHRSRLGIIISSFDHELIKSLRTYDKGIQLGLLFDRNQMRDLLKMIPEFAAMGINAIHIGHSDEDKSIISLANKHDMKVIIWSLKTREVAQSVKALGADGIIVDCIEDM